MPVDFEQCMVCHRQSTEYHGFSFNLILICGDDESWQHWTQADKWVPLIIIMQDWVVRGVVECETTGVWFQDGSFLSVEVHMGDMTSRSNIENFLIRLLSIGCPFYSVFELRNIPMRAFYGWVGVSMLSVFPCGFFFLGVFFNFIRMQIGGR